MIPAKEKFTVVIAGQAYHLVCLPQDGSPEEAARLVDSLVSALMASGNYTLSQAAIVAAISLAKDLGSIDKRLAKVSSEIEYTLS